MAADEEIARLRALAVAGAGALRTPGQWEAWLRRAAQFADLGFTNTMLIWAQDPDAVLVHDYAGWKRRGRQVNRGERGIRIIVPGRSEHVTTVFDLLQTNGKPQAVLMKTAEYGETARWQALASLGLGVAAVEDRAAALALVGKMARTLAGAERGLAGEVEADSVAFLIALRLGLDTSGFAFPHVASWAGTDHRSRPGEIVAAAGERILAAARTAFARIDAAGAAPVRVVTGPVMVGRDRPQPAAAASGDQAVRVLEEAGRFFASRRPGSWVPRYLAERGFAEDIQLDWSIGYAPAGWTTLTDHLRELGFGDPAIEASGLAKRSARGTLIDVFRDRAVFPVRSLDGTIAGFTGRAGPGAGKEVPKYLNGRETALYRKGRVLFGLREGPFGARREGAAGDRRGAAGRDRGHLRVRWPVRRGRAVRHRADR